MHHQIDTVLARALVDRRGEGVVRNGGDPMSPGDRRDRGKIGDREGRVRGCLDHHQPRLGPERRLEGGRVGLVDLAHGNAEARQQIGEQARGAHVVTGLRNDVIARRDVCQHRSGDRPMPEASSNAAACPPARRLPARHARPWGCHSGCRSVTAVRRLRSRQTRPPNARKVELGWIEGATSVSASRPSSPWIASVSGWSGKSEVMKSVRLLESRSIGPLRRAHMPASAPRAPPRSGPACAPARWHDRRSARVIVADATSRGRLVGRRHRPGAWIKRSGTRESSGT